MHRRLDELLSIYVVFRTPLLEDEILTSYLARLVVVVEAFAFSNAPPPDHDPKSAPPKELLHSSTITDARVPTIVRHEEGEAAYLYIIWKVDVFICEKPEVCLCSLRLISCSSTPGQISQTCCILPAHRIIQACGKS